MGEIGFPRREFLYDIAFWEARRIIQGYERRSREPWSRCRWQTYNIMCTGMADLKKAGIQKPSDLITFPWEDEKQRGTRTAIISEDDFNDLQELMRSANKRTRKKNP